MSEALDLLFNASLWAAVLRIATPLIFGVLGALLCERAGVLNLGIEGIMTMGAMVGWLSVFLGADLWTGLLIAAAAGAVMGLLHALLTVPLGLSQHVSGLGITLFASALAYYLYRLIVEVGDTGTTKLNIHNRGGVRWNRTARGAKGRVATSIIPSQKALPTIRLGKSPSKPAARGRSDSNYPART